MTNPQKSLAELAGGFIHEIKNRLGTLSLNSSCWRKICKIRRPRATHLGPRAKDADRGRAAQFAFKQLLRFARIEQLERAPADLAKLVEEMIDFFEPTAKAANIDIRAICRRLAGRAAPSRDVQACIAQPVAQCGASHARRRPDHASGRVRPQTSAFERDRHRQRHPTRSDRQNLRAVLLHEIDRLRLLGLPTNKTHHRAHRRMKSSVQSGTRQGNEIYRYACQFNRRIGFLANCKCSFARRVEATSSQKCEKYRDFVYLPITKRLTDLHNK